MNKINIDKMFKEKILEHEKSSGVYKPEHWNSFEKQLDKVMPVAKKNNFWFTLNNILIVLSVLTGIVVVPFLILHSSEVNSSSLNPQTITFIDRNINPSLRPIATIENKKTTPVLNVTLASYYANKVENTKSLISTSAPESSKQTGINKEPANNNDQITAAKTDKVPDAAKSISVTHCLQQPTATTPGTDSASVSSDNTAKTPTNKTVPKKGKRGKKSRKNVLVPNLNYNGL